MATGNESWILEDQRTREVKCHTYPSRKNTGCGTLQKLLHQQGQPSLLTATLNLPRSVILNPSGNGLSTNSRILLWPAISKLEGWPAWNEFRWQAFIAKYLLQWDPVVWATRWRPLPHLNGRCSAISIIGQGLCEKHIRKKEHGSGKVHIGSSWGLLLELNFIKHATVAPLSSKHHTIRPGHLTVGGTVLFHSIRHPAWCVTSLPKFQFQQAPDLNVASIYFRQVGG